MADLTKILNGPWEPPPQRTPEEQYKQSMIDAGIVPPASIVFDGAFHRFATNDKSKDDAGWYVGFHDPIHAGAYGDWRTGQDDKFREDLGRQLTALEQIRTQENINRARKMAKEEREKRANMTADSSAYIWASCQEASGDHPYLQRKGVKAHGIRVSGDGRLIVPLYDQDGNISSLQYIDAAGEKRFHPGGSVKERFMVIGDAEKADRVYIAEGFATAATIAEETGKPVVVAFSAQNLPPVVGIIKELFKTASLIVVADNDATGVGESYATQAAAKHGARVVIPSITGDVNDYRLAGGDVRSLLSDGEANIIERLEVVFGAEVPEEYDAPDEIVEDLLVAENIAVLYGASNSGKTFFALSLAAAVSEGEKFLGKRVDQGIVVYLASEAPGTIRQRMQAIKKETGQSLQNLAMVPVPLNFYSGNNDANDVIELCLSIERKKGQPVKLIIGDTLARMSSGANENSGEDMAPIMDRFDAVAKATGAAMLIIHHSGKNRAAGSRGWSGIQAHISTEIEVTDENGLRCAEVTKQRELPSKGVKINFDLKVIPMGIGKFGNEVSTCVVVPDERERPKERTAKQLEYIKMIMKAWGAVGGDINGIPYISRENLRNSLVENLFLSEQTVKKYFQPGFKRGPIFSCLGTNDIVEHADGFLIIAPDFVEIQGIYRDNGDNRSRDGTNGTETEQRRNSFLE